MGVRMNREERRRQEREQRKQAGADPGYRDGRWTGAPTGRLTEVRPVEPERADAEVQDFLAGTMFAAGAALLHPDAALDGSTEPANVPPLFTVLVNEDASSFGPAPVLRQLFAALDREGAEQLGGRLSVATGWTVLTRHPNALVKLKLDVLDPAPLRGSARIVLLAENYPGIWQYVAGGGMVGVTSMARLHRVQSRPGASYADGLSACIPLGIASSPGITNLIDTFGWPADHLTR
jgi:hypothetical protein